MDALGFVILLANVICLFMPGNAFWPLNLAVIIMAIMQPY